MAMTKNSWVVPRMLLRRWLAIVLLTGAPLSFAEDWAEKWFDNAVTSKPTHFKSQQRGFYSAGSFSGRLDLQNDHPISVSLPKISAGCGGIDAFLGGIHLLDAEYMMKKLQRVLQAAPSYAFDMALKTMCKECSETIAKLEAATNFLNGIQMDECAMSKRLVATVSRGDPNIVGEMWSEMSANASLNNNTHKHWKEAQERISDNPDQVADLKKLTDGCPVGFRETFKNGSLINNSVSRTGINLSAFADLIRGYVGDVLIVAGDNDKIPLAQQILPCPENQKNTLEDMLHGRSHARQSGGTCKVVSRKSILTITHEKLTELAKHMKGKNEVTKEDIKFIQSIPNVPVFIILRNAIVNDEVESTIESINDIVATNYTWFIFNDLYRHIDYLFATVDATVNTPSANAKGLPCDTRVFAPAIAQFEKLYQQLKINQQQLAGAFKQKMDAFATTANMKMFHIREEKASKHKNKKPQERKTGKSDE